MVDYKLKYFKYKNKYLKLKGGAEPSSKLSKELSMNFSQLQERFKKHFEEHNKEKIDEEIIDQIIDQIVWMEQMILQKLELIINIDKLYTNAIEIYQNVIKTIQDLPNIFEEIEYNGVIETVDNDIENILQLKQRIAFIINFTKDKLNKHLRILQKELYNYVQNLPEIKPEYLEKLVKKTYDIEHPDFTKFSLVLGTGENMDKEEISKFKHNVLHINWSDVAFIDYIIEEWEEEGKRQAKRKKEEEDFNGLKAFINRFLIEVQKTYEVVQQFDALELINLKTELNRFMEPRYYQLKNAYEKSDIDKKKTKEEFRAKRQAAKAAREAEAREAQRAAIEERLTYSKYIIPEGELAALKRQNLIDDEDEHRRENEKRRAYKEEKARKPKISFKEFSIAEEKANAALKEKQREAQREAQRLKAQQDAQHRKALDEGLGEFVVEEKPQKTEAEKAAKKKRDRVKKAQAEAERKATEEAAKKIEEEKKLQKQVQRAAEEEKKARKAQEEAERKAAEEEKKAAKPILGRDARKAAKKAAKKAAAAAAAPATTAEMVAKTTLYEKPHTHKYGKAPAAAEGHRPQPTRTPHMSIEGPKHYQGTMDFHPSQVTPHHVPYQGTMDFHPSQVIPHHVPYQDHDPMIYHHNTHTPAQVHYQDPMDFHPSIVSQVTPAQVHYQDLMAFYCQEIKRLSVVPSMELIRNLLNMLGDLNTDNTSIIGDILHRLNEEEKTQRCQDIIKIETIRGQPQYKEKLVSEKITDLKDYKLHEAKPSKFFDQQLNWAIKLLFEKFSEKILPELIEKGIFAHVKGSFAVFILGLLNKIPNIQNFIKPDDIDLHIIIDKEYSDEEVNEILNDIFNSNIDNVNKRIKTDYPDLDIKFGHVFMKPSATGEMSISKIGVFYGKEQSPRKIIFEWVSTNYEKRIGAEIQSKMMPINLQFQEPLVFTENIFTQFTIPERITEPNQFSILVIDLDTCIINLLYAIYKFRQRLLNIQTKDTFLKELKDTLEAKGVQSLTRLLGRDKFLLKDIVFMYNTVLYNISYLKKDPSRKEELIIFEIVEKILYYYLKISSDSIYPEKVSKWMNQLEILYQML